MTTKIKVGDRVGYKSHKEDEEFSHVGIVLDVTDEIPSCPFPMVGIEGKAGYVRATHCTILEKV